MFYVATVSGSSHADNHTEIFRKNIDARAGGINSEVFELNKLLSGLNSQEGFFKFYRHKRYSGWYHTITSLLTYIVGYMLYVCDVYQSVTDSSLVERVKYRTIKCGLFLVVFRDYY
jgi:hypothetical protein